jgi:WD40 repeat protein
MKIKNLNNLNIKTQLGGVIPGDVMSSNLTFLNSFGSRGSSNEQFKWPKGLALDNEGNLIVVDSANNRLQIFRYSDIKYMRTIGSKGNNPGQFNNPIQVVLISENIIVCDSYNHRIQILRYSDGLHIRTIGKKGSGNGELEFPKSIAIDSQGNIAIYDLSGRIQVFDINNSSFLRSICKKGTDLCQLSGYGNIIFDRNDNIVVVDSDNNCIKIINYYNGEHIRTIGSYGVDLGKFNYPNSIIFDDAGNIIVAELDNNRIQILRYSDGQCLGIIGNYGIKDGEFDSPNNIVIDNKGHIIVSDTQNDRIQIFGALYIKQKNIIINNAKITKNIHKSFVYSTVYNNDYTKFISTSGDSTLIIWNIKHIDKKIKDIKIEKILTGHLDRVVCVAWNLDSCECASGSNDCSVIIWDTDSGSIIKKYDDHDEIVRSVDYNNKGILASGSDDKTVIIYNKEKTILHHKNRVRCIKWNPVNHDLLLSGCDDFSITLWDVSNKSIIRTFKEHTNFIYSLVWNDGIKFASSSGDETIIIWNTEEVKSTKVLTGHVGNVWSIDWKGDVLVSGGNDKKILVWNTTNYTNRELIGHTGYVLTVNIDVDKNIISGGTDNIIKVWNIL